MFVISISYETVTVTMAVVANTDVLYRLGLVISYYLTYPTCYILIRLMFCSSSNDIIIAIIPRSTG